MTDFNFITTFDAAKRLGIHKNTVMKLIGDGRMKAHKICGRWLVEEEELENIHVIHSEDRERPTIVRLTPEDFQNRTGEEGRKRRGKKTA